MLKTIQIGCLIGGEKIMLLKSGTRVGSWFARGRESGTQLDHVEENWRARERNAQRWDTWRKRIGARESMLQRGTRGELWLVGRWHAGPTRKREEGRVTRAWGELARRRGGARQARVCEGTAGPHACAAAVLDTWQCSARGFSAWLAACRLARGVDGLMGFGPNWAFLGLNFWVLLGKLAQIQLFSSKTWKIK